MRAIAADKGVPVAPLQAILARLGELDVPIETIPARLAAKADEYLALRITQPHFANARSVRNAIDRIKLRQANRLLERGGSIPVSELTRIDADDIRQSRVFLSGPAGALPA